MVKHRFPFVHQQEDMRVAAHSKSTARRVIDSVDVTAYANKAIAEGKMKRSQVREAANEYRHYMLLVWMNNQQGNKQVVVPTELADHIWHQHILDSVPYRRFCDNLIGRYIDHIPGLKKGSTAHKRATQHTQQLSRDTGSDGYVPVYLIAGSCGGSAPRQPDATPVVGGEVGGGVVDGGGPSCGGGGGGGCGGS